MPNKLIVALLVVNFAGLSWLIVANYAFKEKVAYVNSTKLINSYKGMEDARKLYQSKISLYTANIDTLILEVQDEIARYEKESPKMTLKERELSQRLIKVKQQQLNDYQKAMKEKAGQEDAVATKKVLDEINAYLKEYGAQKNFYILFAATDYGNIAYAKESLDVTEEILEGLNKKYSGASAN